MGAMRRVDVGGKPCWCTTRRKPKFNRTGSKSGPHDFVEPRRLRAGRKKCSDFPTDRAHSSRGKQAPLSNLGHSGEEEEQRKSEEKCREGLLHVTNSGVWETDKFNLLGECSRCALPWQDRGCAGPIAKKERSPCTGVRKQYLSRHHFLSIGGAVTAHAGTQSGASLRGAARGTAKSAIENGRAEQAPHGPS